MFAAPVPAGQARVLGITLFAIVLWIVAPVPPWVTGLVDVGLIGLARTPSLALSGFQKPATWLIVFGLVVGEATRRSGLATATQSFIFDHLDVEGANARGLYYRLLALLCAVGLTFALLLPAALVCVLIAIPVLVVILRADLLETRDVVRTATLLSLATIFLLLPAEIGYLTL